VAAASARRKLKPEVGLAAIATALGDVNPSWHSSRALTPRPSSSRSGTPRLVATSQSHPYNVCTLRAKEQLRVALATTDQDAQLRRLHQVLQANRLPASEMSIANEEAKELGARLGSPTKGAQESRPQTAPAIAWAEKAKESGTASAETAEEEELPNFSSVPGMGAQEYPGFPVDECPSEMPDLSNHHSVMANMLKKSPEMYTRLCDLKTQGGLSIARCIKGGIDHTGHPMVKVAGLVAGDAECYDCFREIFDPVVSGMHPTRSQDDVAQPLDVDISKLSDEPLDPSGKCVTSVQVQMGRNLSDMPFPIALSHEQRREVELTISGALMKLQAELQGDYLPLRGSKSFPGRPRGMTAAEEAQLKAEEVLFGTPESVMLVSAGLGRDWPDARGIFAARHRQFFAWINQEDHLRLLSTRADDNLKAAFRDLSLAEDALRAELGCGFAQHGKLGYLTTSLENLGTALQVEVSVQLPLLSEQPGFRAGIKRLRLLARRNPEAGDGGWVLLNADRLGSSEVDQVEAVMAGVRQLVVAEVSLAEGKEVDMSAIGAPS